MDGIEKIKILASEVTNKPVLKIVDHLVSREDMNEKYLNEEKSLRQMISFIKSEAQKQEDDGCAILEDEEVYSLAIHYWDESNEALGLNSKEIKKESKKNKVEELTDEIKDESEDEVFYLTKNKVGTYVNGKKKDWTPEGQLTLF